MINKEYYFKKELVMNYIVILIVLSLCFTFLLLPLPEGLSKEGRYALIFTFLAIVAWAKEIMHPALTALTLVVIFPLFGIVSYNKAVAGLGNTAVWLLIGVFIISAAIHATGLDKRLALYLLKSAKGNSHKTLLMVIVTTTLFIFILPSAAGRAAILTPICLGMIGSMGIKSGDNISKSMLLAITFTCSIGSIGLMTGALSIVYAVGLFESLVGYKWTYLSWMITMFPGALLINFLIWPILIKLFPPEIKLIPGGMEYIKTEINNLGRMSRKEILISFLLVVMILLWIFEEFINMSVSQSTLLIATVLMLPGLEIVHWKKAMQSIDWGIVLLLGASLTLVEGLTATKSIDWLANNAFRLLEGLDMFTISFMTMIIIGVIRLGFPNLLSMTATTLPIIITVALSTNINPIWLGLIGICGTTLGIFLPTQSMTHLQTYNAGFYTIKDMLRAGFFTALTIIIVTLLMAHLYWPLLGIHP